MPEPIHLDEQGNILININGPRMLKIIVILILAWVAYYLPIPGLTDASRICLMIFVGVAGLWITETIPLFATAIIVVVLNVYLLGQPGGPLVLEETGISECYQLFLNSLASPILVLFFGGFIMAVATTKHRLNSTLHLIGVGKLG